MLSDENFSEEKYTNKETW